MTNTTGIYAIENLYAPKVYVGSTKEGFRQRWKTHLSALRQGYHFNDGLRNDVRIYSACSFRMVVLQELPRFVAMAPFEQFWIEDLCRRGLQCYNSAPASDKNLPPVSRIDESVQRQYHYTVNEFSRLVNISHATTIKLIHAGVIDAVRDAKGWHISQESYEQFPEYWKSRWLAIRQKITEAIRGKS